MTVEKSDISNSKKLDQMVDKNTLISPDIAKAFEEYYDYRISPEELDSKLSEIRQTQRSLSNRFKNKLRGYFNS